MAMHSAIVTIRGISPLLMHRYPLVDVAALDKKTPEEQAEHAAYRDPETKMLFIPAIALQRGLVAAAVFSKGKGRASLQKVVAACVFVSPERLSLGTIDYKIDTQGVVIPSTRGRIRRHRPRLDQWEPKFTIEWDPDLLKEDQIRQVVDDCGRRVGLLDFRPACKGMYGRFVVIKWESNGST